MILAALLMMVSGIGAQPVVRQMKVWRGTNSFRPDSLGKIKSHVQQLRMHQQGFAGLLNLTDEQKESFKKMRLETYKKVKDIQNQLGEAMAHQKTLNGKDDPDMSAIEKNLEKIGDLRTEIAKIRTKQFLEMRAQLTEEQRMKLDQMKEMRKHKKGPQMDQLRKNFNFNGMDKGPGRFEFGGEGMRGNFERKVEF